MPFQYVPAGEPTSLNYENEYVQQQQQQQQQSQQQQSNPLSGLGTAASIIGKFKGGSTAVGGGTSTLGSSGTSGAGGGGFGAKISGLLGGGSSGSTSSGGFGSKLSGLFGGGSSAGASSGSSAGSKVSKGGPWAALAAVIVSNEYNAKKGGYRSSNKRRYAQDVFTGEVLGQDLEKRWLPKLGLKEDSKANRWVSHLIHPISADLPESFRSIKKLF